MESLIPLIIMLIVGSLFRKKKGADKPNEEQAKPVTAQQENPDGPVKKLTEMYRQMQQEMQQEMEPKPGEPQRQTAPHVAAPTKPVEVQPPLLVNSPTKQDSKQSNRISRSKTRSPGRSAVSVEKRRTLQTVKSSDFLPRSEKDLIKGVIFSEIFGPPKSKR